MIGELYAVEREAAEDPDPEARRARLRGERSREIVGRIHRWALETEALPQSGLRKAIEYMGSLWKGLIRFLEDPRIPLDNNASERALRGPVVGRKNHYGSQSRRGTEVAALFYSAIESAKLAGVEHDRAGLGGGDRASGHHRAGRVQLGAGERRRRRGSRR